MLKRNELPENVKWKLEDIYSSEQDFENDFSWIQSKIPEISAMRGTLKAGGKSAVLNACAAVYNVMEHLSRLYSYASMLLNTDNGDSTSQALFSRAQSLLVEFETATAFLSPEILSLPKKTVHSYITDSDFADYQKMLTDTELLRPHTLSAEQESLLASAGEVLAAPGNIYSMFTDVDMKLGKVRTSDGNTIELSNAVYGSLMENPDRKVRKAAYEQLHKAYGSFGSTFAATYSASVKSDVFNARSHGFSTAREAALYPNQIPESVYDNLIAAVHDAIPVLNAYCGLRKNALNIPTVHMYDLYVPMIKDFSVQLSYDEAYEQLLDVVKVLGTDYQDTVRKAKDQRWIDVYETPNKTTGAYSCGSAYGIHPYILLNYRQEIDGLLTLAHEMGHTMHSYYSNNAQPFSKSDYTIFVAEVASTCNEVLTIQSLRKRYVDNKAAQASLIGRLLEGFRTTVFRQTMFAEFELKAHQMEESGIPLTRDSLSEMYYQLNKTYYGGGCTVDKVVESEWMRIPHFYRSYYVYQYATGFCAAVALADQVLNGGKEGVAAYHKFLTLGGSLPPIEELKIAGVDMSTPEPVAKALDLFAELLSDFCEIQES